MKASGRRSADEVLAAHIAAGRTIAESATAAGVGESTAYRRLKCPAFAARVRELRAGMVGAALGKLTEGMTAASDVLVGLLKNKNPETRFRAAAKVIELALRVREQTEVEERLAAVERALRGEGERDEPEGAADEDREDDEQADGADGP